MVALDEVDPHSEPTNLVCAGCPLVREERVRRNLLQINHIRHARRRPQKCPRGQLGVAASCRAGLCGVLDAVVRHPVREDEEGLNRLQRCIRWLWADSDSEVLLVQ